MTSTGSPLDAVKTFVSLERQNPTQPILNAQKAYAALSSSSEEENTSSPPSAGVLPTSAAIKANTAPTELSPSSPISAPAVAAFAAAAKTAPDAEIATAADAEAGAPLSEILSNSSAESAAAPQGPTAVPRPRIPDALKQAAVDPMEERRDSGIAIAADAEAGVPLTEVVSAEAEGAFRRASVKEMLMKPAVADIGLAADAEAGVSLSEVMPEGSRR